MSDGLTQPHSRPTIPLDEKDVSAPAALDAKAIRKAGRLHSMSMRYIDCLPSTDPRTAVSYLQNPGDGMMMKPLVAMTCIFAFTIVALYFYQDYYNRADALN